MIEYATAINARKTARENQLLNQIPSSGKAG
jgi:hypothetical protein